MKSVLPLLSLFVLSSCGNTFYITRHAEKAKPLAGMSVLEANDPPLSDSGILRALVLKDILKSKSVRYIFSTNYKRTISTAKPLDEYLTSTYTQIYNPKKDSTDAFIEKLKLIRKGNVLIVGHSNTIDDIANKLCGSTVVPADLKETDYDNLYQIKRRGDKYIFKGKTYGAPTE
jgi:phosphohistidine phosphatase SixA